MEYVYFHFNSSLGHVHVHVLLNDPFLQVHSHVSDRHVRHDLDEQVDGVDVPSTC